MEQAALARSGFRLRLGLFCILLWWLPIWLLSPAVSDLLGVQSSAARHEVLVAMVVIQTIVGVAGFILASREVVSLIKKVPRRKIPGTIWHMILAGKVNSTAIHG
jgi:glucose dehydrogenase